MADMSVKTPNMLVSYLHCAKCLAEKPKNQSPREWASLEVGMTAEGAIQVWCKRHELNVVVLTVPDMSAPPVCSECAEAGHGGH